MDKQNIHRQLKRQINKYLPDDLIADNPALSNFIDVVNSTYLSYERDAELFEHSSLLNDIEYFQINKKINRMEQYIQHKNLFYFIAKF